jgi:hypothetical protein
VGGVILEELMSIATEFNAYTMVPPRTLLPAENQKKHKRN